ncbi:Na+/solute symporter [Beggiatoa sp. PS]|nr:Na+/solute symporter [Beggiatoa sp. PS]
MKYHKFLSQYAELPPSKKSWKPFAWVFTLSWFIFAVGPGAVLGNDFFGNPNDSNSWWFFGFIPIWAWQAVWWGLGVAMMAFLAYYMEMSTIV